MDYGFFILAQRAVNLQLRCMGYEGKDRPTLSVQFFGHVKEMNVRFWEDGWDFEKKPTVNVDMIDDRKTYAKVKSALDYAEEVMNKWEEAHGI